MIRGAHGRPFRFFAIMMVGWIIARIFSPDTAISDVPSEPSAQTPATWAAAAMPQKGVTVPLVEPKSFEDKPTSLWTFSLNAKPPKALRRHLLTTANPSPPGGNILSAETVNLDRPATDRLRPVDRDERVAPSQAVATPPPIISTPSAQPDRWRGSAWLLWRQNSEPSGDAVPGGRLGGSQAGLRLDYDLAPSARSRIAAYGRVTGALGTPVAPEAAIGLSVQPARAVPVSIAFERRIALEADARNANAVMVVGGFGPTPIVPAVEAEGYAQTGVVGFRRRDAFIDGKLSLSTRLTRTPVRLGVAISGGAQPGVSRLDIGPELQVRLPLPQVGARLSVEWRERIAGDARPGSGLAITLGADF